MTGGYIHGTLDAPMRLDFSGGIKPTSLGQCPNVPGISQSGQLVFSPSNTVSEHCPSKELILLVKSASRTLVSRLFWLGTHSRILLEHHLFHGMLEELVNHKPSLSSQIKEGKVILEQPRSIRCEEYQSLSVCTSLQHMLHA